MDDFTPSYQEHVLMDGAFFISLIKDIEAAQSSIDLEAYIFALDSLGETVARALINAARRGVKVRVLVDGAGSADWGGKMVDRMEKAGVKTRIFHPFPLIVWHWGRAAHVPSNILSKLTYLFSHMNSRNHRKTCVIDKYIVYAGSANICQCHLKKSHGGEDWHDISIKLVGVDTRTIQYAVDKSWSRMPWKGRSRAKEKLYTDDPVFRINYSWRQRNLLYRSLIQRLTGSMRRIWIMNAYFVPDHRLLNTLVKAAKRGVDVRILLPQKSDVPGMPLVSATFYTLLLKAGVKIYEFLPRFLHAKVLIIDNLYTIGTSNWNHRSVFHDLEIDINVYHVASQKILEKQYLQDLNESKRITFSDIQKIPFFKMLLGRLLLMLRYWL